MAAYQTSTLSGPCWWFEMVECPSPFELWWCSSGTVEACLRSLWELIGSVSEAAIPHTELSFPSSEPTLTGQKPRWSQPPSYLQSPSFEVPAGQWNSSYANISSLLFFAAIMLKQAFVMTLPISDLLSVDVKLSGCSGDFASISAVPLHYHQLENYIVRMPSHQSWKWMTMEFELETEFLTMDLKCSQFMLRFQWWMTFLNN